MPTVISKYKLSVSDYYKMAEVGILSPNEKVELLNGEIYTKSPKTPLHSSHIRKINVFLMQKLGSKVIISVQNPITLDKYSEPEPDLAILDYKENFYFDQHPSPSEVKWIIEVADTSLEHDRKVKLPLYAPANIPEYWIINLVDKCIEVYQNPMEEDYQKKKIYSMGEELQLPILEEMAVVDSFFI